MSRALLHVDLQLGDRDDRARVGGGAGAAAGVLFADGGSGDDVLDGRNGTMAGFNGGGGTDQLYGAQLGSFLTDGDRDGARGDAAPGPDVIEGGPGHDTVSYRQRSAPVRVDLARGLAGEVSGEDTVRAVESVDGGAGDDYLSGDRHSNSLNGGGGRDVLTGRRGADVFGVVDSSWHAMPPSAGTAAEPLSDSAAGDAVRCGAGNDSVDERRTRDFTRPSCEWVQVRRSGRTPRITMPAYPTAHGSGFIYHFACRDEERRRPRCSGRMVLRRPSGAVVAHGRVGPRNPMVQVPLALTRVGRTLAARRAGVLTQVRFRGRNLPADGWTIRLRLPRK